MNLLNQMEMIIYLVPLAFKNDRPEEVLMTVTNSLNTNPMSPLEDPSAKKTIPTFGMMGMGGGLQINTNPKANGNEVPSAKKENEKKWKKRI